MATEEYELKVILQNKPPAPTEIPEIPEIPEIDTDCLVEITNTQQQLSQVKQSLSNIVDSMVQNPSIISRYARSWGELPIWQKVAGGVTIVIATLPVAFITNAGGLLAVAASLTAYTTGGFILEDHHQCSKLITDNLKNGILSLADVLELTITALDKIREKFKEEIEQFRVQNVRLSDNIFELTRQIESLTSQLELFVETEMMLRATKEKLEETNLSLKNSVEQKSHLLEENQKALEKAKHEYDVSQRQLSEKIIEIGTVRTTLGLEVDKAKKVAATLQGTVKTLAGTVISDASHREQFQEKLDLMLTNGEKSLVQVAARLCATEKELSSVKDELNSRNELFAELLDSQAVQIKRLEEINSRAEQIKPNKIGGILGSKGFYSSGLKSEKKPLAEANAIPSL